MRVSVVIPVFNAAAFVGQAVDSALSQPETAEVLLVEDGSPDGSLAACQQLASTDNRVRLLRHPRGENRGAAASRNVGLREATSELVAFLDADDYYLPGRFSRAVEILAGHHSVDGVYEATGTAYEGEEARRRWVATGQPELTTIRPGIPADRLLYEQSPVGMGGHCHLNGLTVRRSVLDRVGFQDEDLDLVEDTAYFIRLAACATLVAGRVSEPVAIRRVHADNRVTRLRSPEWVWTNRLTIWLAVLRWMRRRSSADGEQKRAILSKALWHMGSPGPNESGETVPLVERLRRFGVVLRRAPWLLAEPGFAGGAVRALLGAWARPRIVRS